MVILILIMPFQGVKDLDVPINIGLCPILLFFALSGLDTKVVIST